MQSIPSSSEIGAAAEASASADRRKNHRFDLQFSAILWIPSCGRDWLPGKTLNVSSAGATLQTAKPLPQDSAIEYIVTFPSEMTHASAPLRVRFCGQILRVVQCEGEGESYLVAVINSNYKYLRDEEAVAAATQGPRLAQSLPSHPAL